MSRKPATENKSASPSGTTLEETNAAADKEQAESNKRAASRKPLTEEELAKSGYRFPEGFLSQEDPNAGQQSIEQRAGDGGAKE